MAPDVEEKKFSCDQCPFKTSGAKEIRDHVERHKNPNFGAKKCPFVRCDFEHTNFVEMTKHQDQVHLNHPHYNQKNDRHLWKHIEPLSKGGYKCLICGLVKRDIKMAEIHVAQLHGNQIRAHFSKCLYCSFKTRHTYFLKRHVKVRESDLTSW